MPQEVVKKKALPAPEAQASEAVMPEVLTQEAAMLEVASVEAATPEAAPEAAVPEMIAADVATPEEARRDEELRAVAMLEVAAEAAAPEVAMAEVAATEAPTPEAPTSKATAPAKIPPGQKRCAKCGELVRGLRRKICDKCGAAFQVKKKTKTVRRRPREEKAELVPATIQARSRSRGQRSSPEVTAELAPATVKTVAQLADAIKLIRACGGIRKAQELLANAAAILEMVK